MLPSLTLKENNC